MVKTTILVFSTLLLIGCGGGGGSTSSTSTASSSFTPTYKNKALTNTGIFTQKAFNTYALSIVSNKILTSTEETSRSTLAVYGTINGKATEALLKINTHYIDSNITVVVYKGSLLVGESKALFIANENAINFGEITTTK